jgi:sugar/nucleoside kinase (ribokinase family)
MSAFDLFVVGRPSVDVMFSGLEAWPEVGKDIEADGLGVSAGTAFNTPAAANRLGLRVAFVATIGDDLWSRMIAAEWANEGLPDDFLVVEDHPLPAVSVAMNHEGDRGFVTHWGSGGYYDGALASRGHELARSIDARHLHAHIDDDRELESIARERGMTISLDTWGGPAFESERALDELLENADVLFANEHESLALSGERTVERALERLAEHCSCVVIKLGGDGAIGIVDGGTAVSVETGATDMVDTTGAGDCFDAAFLLGWLGGMELEASLTLGVICGSRAVTDYGGYRACPTRSELRELAAAHGVSLPERQVVR